MSSRCLSGLNSDLNELVTKMAFETIAYYGMGTSFGSFESTEVHPFVSDINEILVLMDSIINSPVQWWPSVRKQKRDFDVVAKRVRAASKEIDAKRRSKETSSPGELPDLLDFMLYTAEAKTDRRVTDEDITNQIITFLVAGPCLSFSIS